MYSSAFFNSKDGDRRYKAEIFAEYFAAFIGNGVFPNPSTGLQVTSGSGLDIIVKPGQAWINGYFFSNKAEHHIKLDASSGSYNRTDRIVVRWSLLDRAITIAVKKGSNYSGTAQPQTVQRDDDVYELGLGDVSVKRAAVSLSQSDITDQRLNTSLCGIVVGTVKEIDTSTLFDQMQDWFSTFKDNNSADFTQWRNDRADDFEEWYSAIKGVLGEDMAGSLLNKIEAAEAEIKTLNGKLSTIEEEVGGLSTTMKNIAGKAALSNTVWRETSSSTTIRTVAIDGVSSWDDVLYIPLFIQAATYGTLTAATLSISGLDAKSLYFPTLAGSTVGTTPPSYYWIRTNQVYCVVWDGTRLQVTTPAYRSASTSYAGIVQLSSSISTTSSTLAATATAVKAAYDYAGSSSVTTARLASLAVTTAKIADDAVTAAKLAACAALGTAIALGTNAMAGSYGTAVGYGASTTGNYGTAMGRSAAAMADNGTAIGYNTRAATNSGALGANAKATGGAAIAVGNATSASANGGIALGSNAVASGTEHGIAIGLNTKASGGLGGVLGAGSTSSHSHGYTIGYFVSTTATHQVLLGASNYTPYAYKALSVISDARDKRDISGLQFDALAFINKLKPVQYRQDDRSGYIQLVEVSTKERAGLDDADTLTFSVKELAGEVKYIDMLHVPGPFTPEIKSGLCRSKDEAAAQYKKAHPRMRRAVDDLVVQDTEETVTFRKVQRERTGECAGRRYHNGFLAQQVKEAADEMGFDFAGYKDHSVNGGIDKLSLTYEEFLAPMVSAIQTLTRQNEELSAQNKDLTARLERLEKAVGI